jgi:hypothetical protein
MKEKEDNIRIEYEGSIPKYIDINGREISTSVKSIHYNHCFGEPELVMELMFKGNQITIIKYGQIYEDEPKSEEK